MSGQKSYRRFMRALAAVTFLALGPKVQLEIGYFLASQSASYP